MSIAIMLSGSISKQPETRTTTKGNPFAFTSVRIPSQDRDTYASITTFDSALVDLLMALKAGNPVTVCGTGKLSLYTTKFGETRPNLSVTVSRIISIADYQVEPRQREAPRGDTALRRTVGQQYPLAPPSVASMQADAFTPAGNEFADDLPF